MIELIIDGAKLLGRMLEKAVEDSPKIDTTRAREALGRLTSVIDEVKDILTEAGIDPDKTDPGQ